MRSILTQGMCRNDPIGIELARDSVLYRNLYIVARLCSLPALQRDKPYTAKREQNHKKASWMFMNKMPIRFMLALWATLVSVHVYGQEVTANKKAILESVEKHKTELIRISDEIWAHAELAFEEYESSKLLADYAEAQGFTVERGVAEMPTAFIATYGSGEPIIGVIGEFDALPGLSQKVQPTQSPLEEGAGGHGCGHNLFGAGGLGAAIAVKELMEQGKLEGTVRFYGTPAEEKYFGKLYFARAGVVR